MKSYIRFSFIILILITSVLYFTGCATGPGFSVLKVNEKTSAGYTILPNQLILRPVGQQINLGDFPTIIKLSPDGKYAAILHTGFGIHEIRFIELSTGKEISRNRIPRAGWGMTFEPNGKYLWVSGGADDVLYRCTFAEGSVTHRETIDLGGNKEKEPLLFPAGLALSANADKLYVAQQRANNVISVDIQTHAIETIATFSGKYDYPYALAVNPLRNELYVTLWGGSKVGVIDLHSNTISKLIPVGQHPTDIRLTKNGKTLYVANSNENSVSVINTESAKVIETLSSSLYPDSLPGSTPGGLALSPDENTLLIANADNNNLAVMDVETPGKSHALGHIPVGWYPTAVTYTLDGKQILSVNGKGNSSFPNPEGPNPVKPRSRDQYIAGLMRGTLSIIDTPDETKLREYTQTAYRCTPYRPDLLPYNVPAESSPIPKKLGDPSPIKYCVYIIKENRTYDQVFGDLPQGNGDSTLCIFGENVSPNHHTLVQDFVLLDNFYTESEVSADGHEWSTAAYATDYVEKVWPLDYGGKGPGLGYPAEGLSPMGRPFNGHLWDRAAESKVTYRSYGEFCGVEGTNEENLKGHFNSDYHSFELKYSDLDRTQVLLKEFHEFEKSGNLPQLMIIRLPNDHTSGSSKGAWTPRAMVGQNDLALGQIIDAFSHSKFWKQMAIFIVEDDAQNGSDHVDAHRSLGMLISPYVKRSYVDHTMYSTASFLRTMELILGIQPMTQFDGGARPCYNSFINQPDFTPYNCQPPKWNITERNSDNAYGQARMDEFNLTKEDSAPDIEFNEIIWKSIKGADSEMPAPVRAGFILSSDID